MRTVRPGPLAAADRTVGPREPAADQPRVLVCLLVCGERERGDDAAALLAASDLAGLPDGVDVRIVGQLDPNDLLDVPEGAACLVVDTLVGVPAGEVRTGSLDSLLQAGEAAGDAAGDVPGGAHRAGAEAAALRSSHTLPAGDVLRLVQALRGRLPRGRYVGIGGASFELGAGLSASVAGNLPALRRAIVREARRLAG